MISMQAQVRQGQETKLSGLWSQLLGLLSLTMLGWLGYQKAACTCAIKKTLGMCLKWY